MSSRPIQGVAAPSLSSAVTTIPPAEGVAEISRNQAAAPPSRTTAGRVSTRSGIARGRHLGREERDLEGRLVELGRDRPGDGGLLEDADVGADAELHRHLEEDGAVGILGHEPEGQDDAGLVAEGLVAEALEGHGAGPEDLDLGEVPRAREVELGRHARLTGGAPIGLPAGCDVDRDAGEPVAIGGGLARDHRDIGEGLPGRDHGLRAGGGLGEGGRRHGRRQHRAKGGREGAWGRSGIGHRPSHSATIGPRAGARQRAGGRRTIP